MPPFLCGGDMIDTVRIEKQLLQTLWSLAGTPPIVQAIALGKAIDWSINMELKILVSWRKINNICIW